MTKWTLIGEDPHGRFARAVRRLREVELSGSEAEADGVVVNLPFAARVDVATRLIRAGKHAIVLGALAESYAEVDALCRLAEHSGVEISANATLRFSPTQEAVRASVSSGRIGAPGLMRVHSWESRSGTCDPLVASVSSEIDLVLSVFASLPNSVYATRFSADEAGSYVQIHLGFEGGGMALIDRARTLPADSPPYFASTVVGRSGAAYADDHHNSHLLFGGGRPSGITPEESEQASLAQLRDFAQAVASGSSPCAGTKEVLRAMRVADCVSRSLVEGRALAFVEGEYELV